MLDIMNALVTTITNAPALQYLQWVGILDSELAPPPDAPQFPFVGIIDGGLSATSLPNKKDMEVVSVKVVAYQSLLSAEPGAHLLGIASLPNGLGTGLLQMTSDLKALLHDNFLGIATIHWAHRDSVAPSEPLLDEQASRIVMMQKSTYTYRRIVG